MDRWEGRYVALRNAEVPIGWSNNPALLQLETYFADHHRVNECLHPSLHFSHPRPVLTDAQSTYIFEEEGRGYFLWNDISGSVAEIKEKSRDGIISKLNDGGLAFITLSLLRTLDGPSGEPTSNIPYLPNPDFVDRAHLTENFQIPPPRSIVLYASDGYGKTELAIQYASKVRTESPQTWVFWLCATTKEQFDEDLLAIADISPERSLTKHNVSQKDLVLDWLRKPTGEQWLMVIDDVNPSDDEIMNTIESLWKSKERGSFVFTTREDLHRFWRVPWFRDSLNLEVQKLSDSEALQLLQKKLKQPNNADDHKLIDRTIWTPLTVQLAAAALNKGLKPVSDFLASKVKIGRKNPFVIALYSLLAHLSSFEKHVLYFVSCFRPPEIPRLWIRSYIEWRNDDEELYELAAALRSLTELSLLTHVSVTNAYKMHIEVQNFMVAWLKLEDREGQILQNIKSCVKSRKFIPCHRIRRFRPSAMPDHSFKMLGTYAGRINAVEKEYGYIEKQSNPAVAK